MLQSHVAVAEPRDLPLLFNVSLLMDGPTVLEDLGSRCTEETLRQVPVAQLLTVVHNWHAPNKPPFSDPQNEVVRVSHVPIR